MAAINDDVYAKVREKIKEHNLTDQEVKAIDTARDKLQSHTYSGGFLGASTAFFLGRTKRFNPFQMLAVTGGGFLIGSQMGLISGALAGIKVINTLPNPQRLINVIREVQVEAMKGRQGIPAGNNNRPMIQPHQMSNQELDQAQNPQDQFSPDVVDNMSGERVWDSKPTYSLPAQQNNELEESVETPKRPQASAWDKIRSENLPNNTWTKLRQEAQQHPDSAVEIEKNKAARAQRLRENDGFSNNVEEIPRTREEALQRGTSRKNQWGDSLE